MIELKIGFTFIAQKLVFLHMLRDRLNPGGQLLIGDVAFETRAQLNACRREAGDVWDAEEFYFVADELRCDIPNLRFTQLSACAGVLSLSK